MLPARPFYLLRHGQSEANALSICAGGQFDSPLNHIGLGQAHALADVIDQLEIKPEVVYHSFMKRAHKTAEIVNETLGLEMHNLNDLRERDCGEWDGLPDSEVWPRMTNGEVAPGGESESVFSQRIQLSITGIMEKETERLPLIVAHGGLFHAIGFLYEYGMSHVQNCHLHYFEPYPSFANFPWRVWKFDIEGPFLVKKPAPFCLSQALDAIAS